MWTQNKLVARVFAVDTHIPFNVFSSRKQVKPVFFLMITLFLGISRENTADFTGIVYLLTGVVSVEKPRKIIFPFWLYFSCRHHLSGPHRSDFYVFGQLTPFWFFSESRTFISQSTRTGLYLLVPYLSACSTDNILLLGAICSCIF